MKMTLSLRSSTLMVNLCLILFVVFTQSTLAMNLVAAGASFPQRLYDALAFAFASELPQYSLSYTSLGSSKGKCRILDYATQCSPSDTDKPFKIDFAGSDSIHRPQDYVNFPDVHMFPAVAGAAVAVYNLPPTVPDLVLPLSVLADIFRKCSPTATCPPGWITYWNDSRIVAANPNVPIDALTEAGEIQVVVRADGSGTTEIFKNALALASSAFVTQIGTANVNDSPNWTNCSVLRGNTNRGVASKVMDTPSSIGYVSLDEAQSSGLRFAGVGNSVLDGVLRATSRSIQYALLERGFSFGNNGDSASHLTASVMGAQGSEAWPIVGYTYFSVRLNATVSDCSVRKAVLHWFEWFYSSNTVLGIALNQGFSPLPAEGRAYVLGKIQSQFRCNGDLVWTGNANDFPVRDSTQARVVPIHILAPPEIAPVISLYSDAYRAGASGFASITTTPITISDALYDTGASSSTDDDGSIISPSSNVLVTTDSLTTSPMEISVVDSLQMMASALPTTRAIKANKLLLPFAAVPWGITYNFCNVEDSTSCAFKDLDLVLTPQLILQLLSGQIAYWNDSQIKDVQASPAQAAMIPFLPVELVMYNSSARELHVFQSLVRLRTGTDLNLTSSMPPLAHSYEEASRRVAAQAGSATFGPVNRNIDTTLARIARMRLTTETSSVIVNGDVTSVLSCIQSSSDGGDNDALATRYQLAGSPNDQCWPFTNAYFVAVPSTFTSAECLSRGAQEGALFASFLMKAYDSSVEDPLSLVGMAKLDDPQTTSNLAALQCFGRSITDSQVDMQLVPVGLIWATRAVAFVMIGIVLALAIWIFLNRAEPILKASSPVFMWQMCVGFIMELCAVFTLTIQDDAVSDQLQLDVACMAAPWLYVTGFTFVYGSLLAKTWRIYRIFNNPAMRRIHITAMYLTRLELLLSLPIFLILALWTALDPFVWVRTVATVDPTTGVPVATKGECASNDLIKYIVPILSLFAMYILSGLILAWKNRDTPTEFSEGRYVTAAIMTDTELLIIGAPILVITSSNPIAAFVVKVLFIFLSVGATLAVFFYPKYAVVKGFWVPDSSSGPSGLFRNVPAPKDDSFSKRTNNRFSKQVSLNFNNENAAQNSSGHSNTPRNANRRRSSTVESSHNNSFFRTGSMENIKDMATSYVNKKPFGSFMFSFGNSKSVEDPTLYEGDERTSTGRNVTGMKSGGNIVLSSLGGPTDVITAFPAPHEFPENHHSSGGTPPDGAHTSTGDELANNSKESVGGGGGNGAHSATMFFGKSVFVSSSHDLSAPSNGAAVAPSGNSNTRRGAY